MGWGPGEGASVWTRIPGVSFADEMDTLQGELVRWKSLSARMQRRYKTTTLEWLWQLFPFPQRFCTVHLKALLRMNHLPTSTLLRIAAKCASLWSWWALNWVANIP